MSAEALDPRGRHGLVVCRHCGRVVRRRCGCHPNEVALRVSSCPGCVLPAAELAELAAQAAADIAAGRPIARRVPTAAEGEAAAELVFEGFDP